MFVSNGIADSSAAAADDDNKNDEIAFLDTYEYLLVVGKRSYIKTSETCVNTFWPI